MANAEERTMTVVTNLKVPMKQNLKVLAVGASNS